MTESPFFPPPVEDSSVNITIETIDVNGLYAQAQKEEAGGIVLFSGTVRNHHGGKVVLHLEYESFQPLALSVMREIVSEAKQKWALSHAHCTHRIGKLQIGESAIVVVTAHAHRAQAYEANQYIMDRVKTEVPIWKNEFFADGTSEWGSNRK